MPTSCVAFGCRSWHRPGDKKSYFRFPSKKLFPHRRAAWIRAVKRVLPSDPNKAWEPSKESRICEDHFVTGEPSLDNSHPDYVPTVFTYVKNRPSVLGRYERWKHRLSTGAAVKKRIVAQITAPVPASTQHGAPQPAAGSSPAAARPSAAAARPSTAAAGLSTAAARPSPAAAGPSAAAARPSAAAARPSASAARPSAAAARPSAAAARPSAAAARPSAAAAGHSASAARHSAPAAIHSAPAAIHSTSAARPSAAAARPSAAAVRPSAAAARPSAAAARPSAAAAGPSAAATRPCVAAARPSATAGPSTAAAAGPSRAAIQLVAQARASLVVGPLTGETSIPEHCPPLLDNGHGAQTSTPCVQQTIEEIEHEDNLGQSVMSGTHDGCRLKIAQMQQRILSLEADNMRLQVELQHHETRRLSVDFIRHDPKQCIYYTGLPEFAVFEAAYDFFAPRASQMQYWSSSRKSSGMKGRPRELELIEEFFMVLTRLRTGMAGREMARNFGVHEATVSRLFTTWINFLQRELSTLTRLPSLHEIQMYLPHAFRYFVNTRIVLDGTEVRIQRPSSLAAQRHTFSPYKHFNTYKAVIGCTADGYVSYVSKLWGGSVSDRLIVEESGLLGLLESGDAIMVDKGFKLNNIPAGVQVHIPAFRKPQEPQMPEEDVAHSRRVASARVIVERVIGRVKQFHILDRPFPITMIGIANQVFQVCCFLSNFREPLTRDD
ncbi:uncharacterized protein LOC121836090 [Ixodes scapularis]|uniref:uncharacterized protein LOC120849513 n=2 Tax=Ixodes scapularis TaxID=6945 RepID=UPI001C37EB38|nr:uncharacterized protein LOC120849513 [Ixodes scapularis]XP_042146731.1 uncharacterized protein LOC121836090 [Ixodes scapularis]